VSDLVEDLIAAISPAIAVNHESGVPSILVLPFVNRSASPDTE